MSFDPLSTARLALACLDLTSLNDADTEGDIERLCERVIIMKQGRIEGDEICILDLHDVEAG